MQQAQILVLAKEPRPGAVKTRLCPPLTPEEAAQVASAALHDTLDAVRAVGLPVVLVLDGSPGSIDTTGLTVQGQVPGGLDVRLAAAFRGAFEQRPLPMLLVGMDTPQVTRDLLADAVDRLLSPRTDAVLGLAEDGGWWALGLRRPDDALLLGVPMSSDTTGRIQTERLDAAGLRRDDLPVLRDIDQLDDLLAAAAAAPGSRTARLVTTLLTGSTP